MKKPSLIVRIFAGVLAGVLLLGSVAGVVMYFIY